MRISEVKNKKIIIDSNIPILYATNGFKERSKNILRILADNDNSLAISNITSYELLNTDPNDQRVKYFVEFINYIYRLEITETALMNAVLLNNEYKRLGCKQKTPLADLIIGGTVISIEDSYLLTTDRNDFCEPLWKTIGHQLVLKEDKDAEANIYLLEFNRDIPLPEYR